MTLPVDLRYALRRLRRSPAFTVVASLSLAVGIGATTTIFSIANAFLLQPLPVGDQGRLRHVYETSSDGSGFHSFSYPIYRELRDRSRALAGLAAVDVAPLSVSTGGDAELALGLVTSWNYFQVLGVTPARGRFFLPEEDVTPRTHPVAVVSDAFWRERLNGDPAAVGRTIRINGHGFTIIGIAPPWFNGTVPFLKTGLWTPTMMAPITRPDLLLDRWEYSTFQLIGRLAGGMSDAAAGRELNGLMRQIAAEHREVSQGTGVELHELTALPTEARRGVALFMGMLMTFALLVLLVAGGNVASMLLARALQRRREIAVRLALGAGRFRLVRQQVTETLLLVLGGAAGAVVITRAATRALGSLSIPAGLPLALTFPLDGRVLGFGLAVALVAGIGFGLVPALQATHGALASQLREGERGATGRSRTWNVLVAGQVAFTMVLLAGAGLVAQALRHAASVDTGLDMRNLYLASTSLNMHGYDPVNGRAAVARWRDRVMAIPGVTEAALGTRAPLGLGNSTASFVIDGREVPPDGDRYLTADFNAVSTEFFEVLGIPIIAGRPFATSDMAGAPGVAVVSEAFARRWFGGADRAIGRSIRFDVRDSTSVRIVGVAGDIKVRSLAEEPRPYLYRPIGQSRVEEIAMFVRTDRPAPGIARAVREALRSVDDGLPLLTAMPFTQHIGLALIPQRVAAVVGFTLGVVGLFLAALGIYGIVAYSLSQRTREIGIRMAIGATPGSVVGLIARQGGWLAGVGLGVGLVLTLGASRLIRVFLLGTNPWDPATLGGIVLVIGCAAAVACFVPASQAARVDPARAMRDD